MAGERIADLGLPADDRELDWFCMKEAVMPWGRFPGADRSAGPRDEVDGARSWASQRANPEAYAKTQLAISYELPTPDLARCSFR